VAKLLTTNIGTYPFSWIQATPVLYQKIINYFVNYQRHKWSIYYTSVDLAKTAEKFGTIISAYLQNGVYWQPNTDAGAQGYFAIDPGSIVTTNVFLCNLRMGQIG
jgi:hypothetical protein